MCLKCKNRSCLVTSCTFTILTVLSRVKTPKTKPARVKKYGSDDRCVWLVVCLVLHAMLSDFPMDHGCNALCFWKVLNSL